MNATSAIRFDPQGLTAIVERLRDTAEGVRTATMGLPIGLSAGTEIAELYAIAAKIESTIRGMKATELYNVYRINHVSADIAGEPIDDPEIVALDISVPAAAGTYVPTSCLPARTVAERLDLVVEEIADLAMQLRGTKSLASEAMREAVADCIVVVGAAIGTVATNVRQRAADLPTWPTTSL